MEAIKKLLSPGSTKDDELMYGSEEARRKDAADNEAKKDSSTLYPTGGQQDQQKESGGVLGQILNPGEKKYDEQAMGTIATTSQPDSSKLQTEPDHKESSFERQTLSPGGNNETAYGTTATTGEGDHKDSTVHGAIASATDSSALGTSSTASNNQANLPIRDATNTSVTSDSNFSRDAAAGGGGATALGAGGLAANQYNKPENDRSGAGQTDGLADGRTGTQAAQDQSGAHGVGRDAGNATVVNRAHDNDPKKGDTILVTTGTTSQNQELGDNSLTSGTSTDYVQPSTMNTSDGLTGAGSGRPAGLSDSSDLASSSEQPGSGSHLGRDASISGGLVAASVGAGAYGATRGNNNESGLSNTASTANSAPPDGSSNPLTSGTSHGHINTLGAPDTSLREPAARSEIDSNVGSGHTGIFGSSHHNAGIAAGGVHNNEGTTQLNQAPSDVQGATFLDRSFYMGKPGDSVSHGPHVPGEFPAATGEDPHNISLSSGNVATGAGLGDVGAGSALSGTTSASTIQTPTNTTQHISPAVHQSSTASDHAGGNAALAGGAVGAGVVGAGAYAASRDQPSSTIGQPGYLQSVGQTPALSQPIGSTQDASDFQQSSTAANHTGRDTALAGGALGVGALGTGAYAASRDQPISTIDQSGLPETATPGSGLSQTTPAGAAQDPAVSHDGRDTNVPTTVGLGSSSISQPATTTTTTQGSTTPRSDVAVAGVPATARDLKQDTTLDDHHYGRDAAAAGDLGAVGAGAYTATLDHAEPASTTHDAYGAEDPNKHNKLHKQSPDDKKSEEEHAKEEKHRQKELEKQQHQAEKQAEKDAKERRHAAEKAEKHHEKEEKDRKPSLIDRILHRHKDDHDGKSGEATQLKENTDNGPLDHPLITAAGTTTSAASAGTSSLPVEQQHGTDSHLGSQRGPLDHPLVNAAGATNSADFAGTSALPAGHQPGGTSDLTGQRQHDLEPRLSSNDTSLDSNTTSTAGGAALGGATLGGAAATQIMPATYQQTGSNVSAEPHTSFPTDLSKGTGAGTGASGTDSNTGIESVPSQLGGGLPSAGLNLTGRRQDDVEPYISGNNNSTTTGSGSGSGPGAAVAGPDWDAIKKSSNA